MEKKLDGNYTRMLRAILNKSWRQHPTKQQLYGHLPPITKTIKIRRTRHERHCWKSKDELISDVLLWTPLHGRPRVERPARTCIQQLCVYTGCIPEDLPEAMNGCERGSGWNDKMMMRSVYNQQRLLMRHFQKCLLFVILSSRKMIYLLHIISRKSFIRLKKLPI